MRQDDIIKVTAGATAATRGDYVRDVFARSIAVKQKMIEAHCDVVGEMAEICVKSFVNGGKLLLCGNGGSASDAQHLAAELLVRLRPHVNRAALPALALTLDMSSITACGNDYSYEGYFERMTSALGRPGDVLLGITTSGRSPNVVRALITAKKQGMATIGFLGGSGVPALDHCDKALLVPSTETGRIQETHITAGHALMELIEDGLIELEALERQD